MSDMLVRSGLDFDVGTTLKKAQIESGNANPASAAVGQLFFNTTTAQFILATAADTWTPLATLPQLAAKADLDSPALTGTPTAPLAVAGTNTTQIATCSFVVQALGGLTAAMITDFANAVQTAVNAYIDTTAGSNEALDTLSEIIAKIQANADGLASLTVSYGADIGNASDTAFTITHNLNTFDVIVSVRQKAAPFSQVLVSNKTPTANTVLVEFTNAPAANEYHVKIAG